MKRLAVVLAVILMALPSWAAATPAQRAPAMTLAPAATAAAGCLGVSDAPPADLAPAASAAADDATLDLAAITTWSDLQAQLRSMVAGWAGENAVSVTDLQTGQTISVNGSRPQPAACTIKIAIMMVVAQDIEAGRYTAAEVDSLVRDAMGPSNTWPARELLRYAGGGDIGVGVRRVNALMQSLGMTNSIMAHPPGYPDEDYGYGLVDNVLTTDDLNLLLGKLYRGQALSPSATDYVLWSMTLAPDWVNASLGGPLPAGVTLYHKFGQLYEPENTWNDGGIVVFSRNGRSYAYAISYLGSYGASWRDAYDHAYQVSAAAWSYFGSAGYTDEPTAPAPEYRYFPETGHTVGHAFLSFWNAYGGLPTFGYPITDEFRQVSPTDGKTYTVQYFERARFEYHPEFAGTPYEVELGLLGVQLAQQQGLLSTAPFQKVSAQSDANCTFYAATGHRLCFGFRDFWQSHGGLMIYGYPISEEYRDPTTGFVTQYFERQRLEWHPENTPAWQVEGGLLGAQVLAMTP